MSPVVAQPSVQSAPLFSNGSPPGLSPNQIRAAYGVNQINFGSVSGTGAGQTIAIIDAYFDPNITSDLKQFDSQFGLTAPPSFTQYVESGLSATNAGWSLETALDVEWAHAIAPDANIVLVEAQPYLSDLLNAVSFASHLPGVSVVSMSWGAGEFPGETAYNSVFTTPAGHNGITFVASSGDSGGTEFPSTSPNVLAVGGTTLNVTSTGAYTSETGWSESGTGSSAFESAPSWQTSALSSAGLPAGSRTTPDVAWDANPSTGVAVYSSGWYSVGGTSLGAPSWAGLIAITDQGLARAGVSSLSNAQAELYQLSTSSFNHPSTGSNGSSTSAATFSLTTGLGSPKANTLVPLLVQLNTPHSTPSTPLPPITTTTAVHPVVGRDSDPSTSSTDPTSTGSTSSASTSSSSSTSPSGTSITALNPNSTAGNSTRTVVPVILVPPPLPPIVLHLNASTAPVVAQAVDAALAAQGEQPMSLTHFGQSVEIDLDKLLKIEPTPSPPAPWAIDVVEPFQPADPVDAPKVQPVPTPQALRAWPSRSNTERDAEAKQQSADGAFRSSPQGGSAKNRRTPTNRSWGFSAIAGTAAVAAGGYFVAIREPGRSKGPSLPIRTGASHPTRRWPRIPKR
jgi:hypothetical protein